MSKLEILRELAELKAGFIRRLAWWQVALVAAFLYVMVTYGPSAWSYLTTLTRMAKDSVAVNVPLEFEIERARTMIGDLIPDIRQNMLVIAQEEVGVENIRHELAEAQGDLDAQREELLRLRANIDNEKGVFQVGSRPATREEVSDELKRRFARFQVAESTVASKKQLLNAREKSLAAARSKLNSMLNAKRDLEVQVEHLAARLKTQQSQVLANDLNVDDSQVARCKELVDGLRARLEVADRLLASDITLIDVSSADLLPEEEIGAQIDRYFAKNNTPENLADARP